MTTDNYSLLKLWESMGGDNAPRRTGGTEVYKVLRSWYWGYLGETSAVNKLVALGAIKKVTKVQVKELVW